MSAEARNTEIKKKRLCIKCLRAFHGRNCKASGCKECHNTLLHEFKSSSESSNNKTEESKYIDEPNSTEQRVAVISFEFNIVQ